MPRRPARRPAKKTARRTPRRRVRRPNPARGSARAPLTHDAVAAMGGAEINKRLDALEKESSRLVDELIAAGRGSERYSETARKSDPLSLRYVQNGHDAHVLHAEIARRYGPGAPSRLPIGFGRAKRTRNPSKRRKTTARRRNPDRTHAITTVTVGGSRRLWTLCGSPRTPDDVKVTDKTRYAYGVTCPICVRAFEMRRGFDAAREERRCAPQRNPSPKPRAPSDATARELDALADGGIDGGDYGEHAVFVSHPAYYGPQDTRVVEIVRGRWVVATHDRAGVTRRKFASRAAAYHYARREHAAAAPQRARRMETGR